MSPAFFFDISWAIIWNSSTPCHEPTFFSIQQDVLRSRMLFRHAANNRRQKETRARQVFNTTSSLQFLQRSGDTASLDGASFGKLMKKVLREFIARAGGGGAKLVNKTTKIQITFFLLVVLREKSGWKGA